MNTSEDFGKINEKIKELENELQHTKEKCSGKLWTKIHTADFGDLTEKFDHLRNTVCKMETRISNLEKNSLC